ncbi:MAG: DUF2225 domain-containing protein [Ktedonobacteraceae bacterium]|nr:DUF2225 domain-containing protein [Ktedonobacteraceae bacterium]
MSTTSNEPLRLFYSYAHADEAWRKRLEVHLGTLKRQGYIAPWHDRDISAGQDWERAVDENLNHAHIILLLISPDFIASDYCYSIEMHRALEQHKAGEAVVIPIILSFVDWQGSPFSKLQVLPTDGKPIISSHWHNSDEAFTHVAQGIRTAIKKHFPDFVPVLATPEHISAPPRTPSATTWNVPYRRNPFFTGREHLLTELRERLLASSTATLSQPQAISGLGGIGKTQTAVEYAYRYRDQYRYVLWVNAATHDTLITNYAALADSLHLPQQQEADLNRVVVQRWLSEHDDWLLIFDNADDVALVEELLPQQSKGHVLLTSRTQIGGSIADIIIVEEMDQQEGTLLLLRRARVISRDGRREQATPQQQSEAQAIVNELGGLPLAIDQAGAYIEETKCSLADYLALYRTRRRELLQRRSRLRSDHPEPVTTTWSLSFQRVEQANPAAADLLRLCAFLAPDAIPEEIFTEGASHLGPVLSPVASDGYALNAAIEELRLYSLVKRNSEDKTLSVHRLVQAVLQDSMDEATQRRWTERALHAVEQAFPVVDVTRLSDVESYLPHAQASLGRVTNDKSTPPETARLLNQIAFYFYERALYTEAEPLYRRGLEIREQRVEGEHPDTACNLNNLAALYSKQGKYEQAEPLYQQALAIYERVLGGEHPEMASSLNNLAALYSEQGKYEQAEPLLKRALAVCERILGAEHPETAQSLNSLAMLYSKQGKYEQAEPLYQQALAIYERVLGGEHPETASSLNNLAMLYSEQGKYEQAEPLLRQALAICERILGAEHPETAQSLNNLAALYSEQGKYEQAERLLERALEIRGRVLGKEHPEMASSLNNLAALYSEQGKYEQAEPLLKRALAVCERILGAEHPETARSLNNLAMLYYEQNRYEQAEPLLKRALEIREEVQGAEHPETASSLNNLAALYSEQGKYEQAEPLLRQALAVCERILGAEHPETARSLNNLATLYSEQGKYEQAEPLYQRALAIRERVLGAEHHNTASSLNNLAYLYDEQGKYEQAEPLYQRALAIYERVFGEKHPNTTIVRNNYVSLLQTMGREKDAAMIEAQAKAQQND